MHDGTHMAALLGFMLGAFFMLGIVCMVQFLGKEYDSFPVRAVMAGFSL